MIGRIEKVRDRLKELVGYAYGENLGAYFERKITPCGPCAMGTVGNCQRIADASSRLARSNERNSSSCTLDSRHDACARSLPSKFLDVGLRLLKSS